MSNLEDTAFEETITYSTFGCKVFKADPDTPDLFTPDVRLHLHGAETMDLRTPDGRKIKVWGYIDRSLPRTLQRPSYPSPTLRVQQGQVIHTKLTTSKGPHTIHHHGIEPSTANDGVGHVSFEVGDSYTYQWQPRYPGTFFYHCHRNTTLHFELGMFGMLIVDPPDQGDGIRRIYRDGPSYDVEALWVADDMDPRWHQIGNHDAGLCGMDVGLNRFEPKYFLLSGVFNNKTLTNSRTQVNARMGQRILIRLLNASYSVLSVRFACNAEVVACDGHAWGREAWCDKTKVLAAGTPIELATAQRYDLFLMPPAPGVYLVTMAFHHWITGAIQDEGRGILQTRIVVT